MSESWYVKRSAQPSRELGPLTLDELRRWAREGRLAKTDTVREGTQGPWRFADSIRGLFERSARPGDLTGDVPADADGESKMSAVAGSHDVISEPGPPALERDREPRFPPSTVYRLPSTKAPQRARDREPRFRSDKPTDPLRAWFYRLNDVEHGPIDWDELTDLMAHSAEAASDVFVRRHDDEEWSPFEVVRSLGGDSPRVGEARVQEGKLTSASSARLSSPKSVESAACPTVQQPDARDKSVCESKQRVRGSRIEPTARWSLRNHVDLFVALGVLCCINAAIWWYYSSERYPLERRYLAELQKIVDDVHELQARNATASDWQAFSERVQVSLGDMIVHLKKSANPSRPVHQHLLWAARDEMPKILSSQANQNEKSENRLNVHLGFVRNEVNRK